jgi:predicted nucleic acid-binding protein
MPASFFDTNVLLYLASGDAAKADQAEPAIAKGGAISVQVLNEIANVARRKMQLSWAETHALLDDKSGRMSSCPLSITIRPKPTMTAFASNKKMTREHKSTQTAII